MNIEYFGYKHHTDHKLLNGSNVFIIFHFHSIYCHILNIISQKILDFIL